MAATGPVIATPFAGTLTIGATSISATGSEEGILLGLTPGFGVSATVRLVGLQGTLNRMNGVALSGTGGLVVVGRGANQATAAGAFVLSGTGGFIANIP